MKYAIYSAQGNVAQTHVIGLLRLAVIDAPSASEALRRARNKGYPAPIVGPVEADRFLPTMRTLQ